MSFPVVQLQGLGPRELLELTAEPVTHLPLSRGAGILARQQATLAGGWMQIAFAVINE